MLTTCIIALGILSGAAVAPAQPPSPTPSAVPVYPGADRVPGGTEFGAKVHETLMGLPGAAPLLSGTEDTYGVAAPVEKVAAHYQRVLGGMASGFDAWKAVDPRKLPAGGSTPVHQQRYTDQGTTKHLYHWYRKEPNGDIVLLELVFYALSSTRTGIQATRKTYSERAASASPDESTLGAPIYPGAVYDSDQSRTMAGGALVTHAFLTGDAVDAVVAFYTARLGVQALKGEPPAGGVTWVFRQYAPAFPDDFLTIQSEDRRGGSFRTRIDFRLIREP